MSFGQTWGPPLAPKVRPFAYGHGNCRLNGSRPRFPGTGVEELREVRWASANPPALRLIACSDVSPSPTMSA